ncbi:MAG: SAF domain-containing protein [Candidatus Obscuribacterales bacterium]
MNQTHYTNPIQAPTSKSKRVVIAVLISSLFPGCVYAEQPKSNHLLPMYRCTQNISEGSTITSDYLKRVLVTKTERPADAIYDPWIAIGRKANKSLAKGQVVHFSDAFSPNMLEAPDRDAILRMHGESSSFHALVPILRAAHDIPAGATISAADIVSDQIKEKNCPGSSVGDIWVVLGRKAAHTIKANEYIYYHEVIPPAEWRKWLEGKY